MKIVLCIKVCVLTYQSAQKDGVGSDVWLHLYMMFRGAYALAFLLHFIQVRNYFARLYLLTLLLEVKARGYM
jgi:hypothetical protein